MGNQKLTLLEARVAELRDEAVPTTQLIDALNALANAQATVNLQYALATAKEAHTLAVSLQYAEGETNSLIRLAWLHLQRGDFDAAVLQARHAQHLSKQLGRYTLEADAGYVIASAHQQAGNNDKAAQLWLELLGMARQQHDRAREADYLSTLAILYQEQGEFALTLDYKLRAYEIYLEINDPNQAAAMNNIAFALTKLGRHDEAQHWAHKALMHCDPAQLVWRAMILHTLGLIHLNQHDLAQARERFDESLEISLSSAGRKQTAIDVYLDRAKLELVNDNRRGAMDELYHALDLASKIQSAPMQAEAHHALYRLYSLNHAHVLAMDHHEQYLAIRHQLGCRRIEQQVQLIRAEAEAHQQQAKWS
jgi:tetratricopeptide (TPR) repeat protein